MSKSNKVFTPDEKTLRAMSYEELQKMARQSGMKRKSKCNELIQQILMNASGDEDSFVTLEREVINSCTKNKEDLFDKNKATPSATPRRETYTLDTPSDNVAVSASPDLNVTMTRGSSRKKQRKVSFVTPLRRSLRLQSSAIKDRQKTPVSKSKCFSVAENSSDEASETDDQNNLKIGTPEKLTESPKKKLAVSNLNVKKTPNFKQIHQKAFDKMESIDDFQKRKMETSAKKIQQQNQFGQSSASKNSVKSKKTRSQSKFGGIPFIPSVTNIQNIQTNFSAAAKAKQKPTDSCNKAKYVPKVLSASKVKTPISKVAAGPKKTPFDLKKSLARKLTYKPHSGPLQPLNDTIMKPNRPSYDAATKFAIRKNKRMRLDDTQAENKVVKAKRIESRTFLHGVRTNKRFELQLRQRKL